MASDVAFMTTLGTLSDDKVDIMMTLDFRCD